MAESVMWIIPEAPAPETEPSQLRTTIAGSGLRFGVLDNSKSNADHLLAMLIDGMKAQMPVASIVSLRKPTPSLPAEVNVLERLAQEADVVVSAMAD